MRGAGRAAPTGRSVLGKRWNSPSSTLGEVEGRRGLEDEQDKTEDFFLMYLDRNFSGSLTEPSELFSYIIAKWHNLYTETEIKARAAFVIITPSLESKIKEPSRKL